MILVCLEVKRGMALSAGVSIRQPCSFTLEPPLNALWRNAAATCWNRPDRLYLRAPVLGHANMNIAVRLALLGAGALIGAPMIAPSALAQLKKEPPAVW